MITVLNYPVKSDFYLSNIPQKLRELLDFACREKYAELYEENHGNILLEDICVKILNQLKDNDKLLTYQRYFFMGLIMSNAVIPTIKIYLPNDDRTEKIYQFVNYLSTNQSLTSSTKFIEIIENFPKNLFPEISFGIQALDEAVDVFENLLRSFESSQSQNSLLEILDDCFQGYAVFPGSENRRDLFNWWLLDVVPAVWKLETPQMLYTIHGLQPYE
jgi:hypothetical protein